GLVSRSGTLTYQIGHELMQLGLGNSTIAGIGGDPVVGSSFIDVLQKFQADPETETVVLVGEIGGDEEEKAARYIEEEVSKPLFGQALLWAIEQVYGLRLPEQALDRCDHAGQTTLKTVRELTGKGERLAECCHRTAERYLQLLAEADTSGWEAAQRARETLEE